MMTDRDFNRMMLPEPPQRGPINWTRVYALLGCGAVLLLFWTGVALLVADTAFAATPTMSVHWQQGARRVSHRQIRQLETANSQYAGLVHQYWGSPTIRFTRNSGTPIILTDTWNMARYCGQGAVACHGVDYNGQPVIVVDRTDPTWTLSVSHEIAETVVDPQVDRIAGPRFVEVCDPVESAYFRFRHNPSMMSDFVTPGWFGLGGGFPFDSGRLLNQAAPQVLAGGFDPLTGYRHAKVASTLLLKRVMP